MTRARGVFVPSLLALCAAIAPPIARAQEAPPEAGLASQNPDDVARSIRLLGQRGDPAAVRALATRIREGLPPRLLDAAVDAVAAVRRYDAQRVLVELSTHRRSSVRVTVARGLATAPGSRTVLVRLLDDQSPQVRSAAATALGGANARGAMRELEAAARRGQPEAIAIVGAQAGAGDVRRIARELDHVGLEALAPALRQMGTRADVQPAARLFLVEKLVALDSPLARHVLRDIANALPPDDRVAIAARAAEEAEAAEAAPGEAPAPPAQAPIRAPPADVRPPAPPNPPAQQRPAPPAPNPSTPAQQRPATPPPRERPAQPAPSPTPPRERPAQPAPSPTPPREREPRTPSANPAPTQPPVQPPPQPPPAQPPQPPADDFGPPLPPGASG